MKYFFDTEFIEGSQKRFFWKTKPTVDLISIGIVAEDGKEYYAISKDFNLKEAWNRWQQRTGEGDRNNIEPRLYWIRENVLKPIYEELHKKEMDDYYKAERLGIYINAPIIGFTYNKFKRLIKKYGKSNYKIAEEVKDFVYNFNFSECSYTETAIESNINKVKPIQFYAYFADYDWVVFCWLFGKMINLPKAFPMYCYDLKQIYDEKEIIYKEQIKVKYGTDYIEQEYSLKYWRDYPKKTNEHNALADAKWNLELYKFLKNIE